MAFKPIASSLSALALLTVLAPRPAAAVSVTTGTVNGLAADIWTWTDAAGHPRTVALKKEGSGNAGHGGYAIQFTYVANAKTITVNAESSSDGGFGYFVSHERYRTFVGGAHDSIAHHIFNKDDSPLGLGFAAATSMPATPAGTGAERFTIQYGHYGTIVQTKVNPNTGEDSPPLPAGQSNYAFYTLPATTTWVFQDGQSYPRIDISVGLSDVIPPGGTSPTADLLSFDMRGPYGVMVFDNGADGTVNNIAWGDQEFKFAVTEKPVTRDSTWTWNVLNKGARFHVLQASGFEMGMFEPAKVSASAFPDGYSQERGFTSSSYAAAGGTSQSSCPSGANQVLPTDGEWPYQSLQFSLPCGSGQFGAPTNFKKFAWGTSAYFGTSMTTDYNGKKSYPLKGFPASNELAYSVCLVVGKSPANNTLTAMSAGSYSKVTPAPNCVSTVVP